MSELDRLRAALTGDVEPLRRIGVLVKLEDCRWPRLFCRWTHHRYGRLRHQREVLRRIEEVRG